MMRNPVYNREMRVSSRSIRLPMILLLFNGILSMVSLLNMYSVVKQVKASAVIQYSSFMDMYEFVTTIEFILLMLIVPAVTAASISSERERQTLELMLTTQMTAFQVVMGKLLSSLSTLLLLILSGMPAVAMVFVYGGITWLDAISLFLCYITVAFFAGSVGICFSAMLKRSTVSTVVTYGVMIAVAAGTYFINKFALSLSAMSLNQTAVMYALGEKMGDTLLRRSVLSVPFESGGDIFCDHKQTDREQFTDVRDLWPVGWSPPALLMEHWIPISILLQLAVGVVLIVLAVRCVEPVKKRHKKRR